MLPVVLHCWCIAALRRLVRPWWPWRAVVVLRARALLASAALIGITISTLCFLRWLHAFWLRCLLGAAISPLLRLCAFLRPLLLPLLTTLWRPLIAALLCPLAVALFQAAQRNMTYHIH